MWISTETFWFTAPDEWEALTQDCLRTFLRSFVTLELIRRLNQNITVCKSFRFGSGMWFMSIFLDYRHHESLSLPVILEYTEDPERSVKDQQKFMLWKVDVYDNTLKLEAISEAKSVKRSFHLLHVLPFGLIQWHLGKFFLVK